MDDVVTQPFEAVDGSIEVPRTPGLRVVVNEDKVREYRINL
jgi:L-alanine-DL-glutamate epimerase-like enolase superfamily enzyme